MIRSRIVHYFLCLALLSAVAGGLAGTQAVLAQEEPEPVETLKLESKFPVLSGESGDDYDFEVDVKYQGGERKRFDLTISVPPDWRGYATAGYPERQVAAVEMGSPETFAATEKIKVKAFPVFWNLPEAGDYVVTLEVSSGDLKGSIELTAKVTAKYEFEVYTETGRLNTEATAGKDNHFALKLANSGSAAIDDITFSSTKPEGWSIKFNPEKVDSLEPGLTQDVDVVINAPKGKTIAGDYVVSINANSKKINDSLELRVTVLTPSIWGWVGIIIVLVVIAGLAVIFRQLGRR